MEGRKRDRSLIHGPYLDIPIFFRRIMIYYYIVGNMYNVPEVDEDIFEVFVRNFEINNKKI